MKNRVIVIGGSFDPQEQKMIEAMIESILKKEHIVFNGGRGWGKTKAYQYTDKIIDRIKSIPIDIAEKMKDQEGYVYFNDLGKIHIQNWIDNTAFETEHPLCKSKHDKQTENDSIDDFGFNYERYRDQIGIWLTNIEKRGFNYNVDKKSLTTIDENKESEQQETAFERRFYAAGCEDCSGKTIRATKIYDRVTEESYTKEEFDALYFKIEKMAKQQYDNMIDLEDLTDQGLDFFVKKATKSDLIPAQEGKTSKKKDRRILLNNVEIQSGLSRVSLAEQLIKQLPSNHNGRNSWLLNYGVDEEAIQLRIERQILFDSSTKSAMLTSK